MGQLLTPVWVLLLERLGDSDVEGPTPLRRYLSVHDPPDGVVVELVTVPATDQQTGTFRFVDRRQEGGPRALGHHQQGLQVHFGGVDGDGLQHRPDISSERSHPVGHQVVDAGGKRKL